jgi:bacillithiol biosynthesis cysteine-adding enzyme BshC
MSEPTVRTEALGGSPLSRAARSGQLPQWYRPTPRGAGAWTDYARDVASSVSKHWLDELRDAIVPSGRAGERLQRSAGGKGIVITTGQQPGLFGGPLMSLVKAITARAIADELQRTLGIPVAPLFWAATDDADFEEAAVVSVALDGGARELRLEPTGPAGIPMTRVPLGDDVTALAAYLRDACGSAPHAAYLDSVLRAYEPGATVGDAYVTVLRQLLEPLEISVLDASHASVTRVGAPLLQRAVASAESLAGAVRRRSEEIERSGFTPQVDDIPGLSLVFLNDAGGKRRLSLADAKVHGGLGDREFLSSTVLLRPVLERFMLPTAAYVAGPGEFAYFAQVSAVADGLGVPAPLVMPRWSTTIVEPRVQRILDDLNTSVDALADPHAVESRVARERLSPDAHGAFGAMRDNLATDVARLRTANDELVPPTVLDGLQRSLEHRLARVERRFLAGVKRRETELMRKVGTARGALYPHGARQERKLGYVPFLARYGPGLIDELLAHATEHARIVVNGLASTNTETVAASASV